MEASGLTPDVKEDTEYEQNIRGAIKEWKSQEIRNQSREGSMELVMLARSLVRGHLSSDLIHQHQVRRSVPLLLHCPGV